MTERRSSAGDEPTSVGGESPSVGDETANLGADSKNVGEDEQLVDQYAVSTDASEEEFLAAAKLYAREVAKRHDLSASISDLEWAVSKRAKRRAGVVKYTDGEPEEVVLTWGHFQEHGWAAATGTIRHELAHVHLLNEATDGGHGDAFQALAEQLDAPVHCERFADPKWWVRCTDCEAQIARYRRSKLVEQPEQYCCADCGGDFRVEAND